MIPAVFDSNGIQLGLVHSQEVEVGQPTTINVYGNEFVFSDIRFLEPQFSQIF